MTFILWLQDWYCLIRYPMRENPRKVKTVDMRHIINGCSINLHQLTDRELDLQISANGHRAVVQRDELDFLLAEKYRRYPPEHLLSIHDTPTLF